MSCTRWYASTRRAAHLLVLAACCGVGCLAPSQNDDPHGPGGKVADSTASGADTIAVPEAYFILDAADLREPDWPSSYARYSFFVCNASTPAQVVDQIHQDLPGSIVLASTSIADLEIDRYFGNPYFDALRSVFDSTRCVMDLAHGHILRMGGLPHFVPTQESAEILVAFHRDVTMSAGWDGLYVDQCTAHYPPWRAQALVDSTSAFDADHDSRPDTVDEVVSQFEMWRPYYTQRLRQEVGDATILVGNAGGALGDPWLNGITLEGVGTRFTIEEARDALLGQRDVSRMPFLAVLWITAPECQEPSRQLAGEIAGAYYGTVRGVEIP